MSRAVQVLASIALLCLTLMIPSAAGAPVAPLTVPGLPTSWAYGANTSAWTNVTNSSGNYVAQVHSFFGFQVILNQTNLSANDTLVELQRAVAFDYQATFCSPTCTNPSGELTTNYTAWQTAVGFVNFTSGTVLTSTGSVPAVAVADASSRVQGNLTEKFGMGYRSPLGAWKTGSDYLTVQAAADLSVNFTPALGLFPLNLSSSSSWTASSSYTESGSWSAAFAWARAPLFGNTTSGRFSPSGSLASSGTVNVFGGIGSPFTLRDGEPTQSVYLGLVGPFSLREGFLFLPTAGDIFQPTPTQSWSNYLDAAGPASTAAVDLAGHVDHLGVLASATSYQTVASASIPMGTTTLAAQVSLGPTTPTGSTQTLQGQPESLAQASQGSSCLTQGTCSGQSNLFGHTSSPGARAVLGLVIAGSLVGLVAVLVGLAVVQRRRQIPPPPPRSNARLYPSPSDGSASGVPPGAAAERAGGATPPGDAAHDPLSDLW